MHPDDKERQAFAEANVDETTADPRDLARSQTRRYLVSEFHLDSAFVPVQKLARVLGLSSSTIYSYIRQGKFFLPYRMFNTSPVVSLDDLVDWYVAGEKIAPSHQVEVFRGAAPKADRAREEHREEQERMDVDSYVREKLVAMGLSPSLRRGSRRPA